MDKQISVVVATYNRLPLVTELLRSLAQQSLAPGTFEVVVVDDGSSPPVRAHLEALTLPYDLLVIEQANGGAAAARHAGIERARGEIVVITDDDMLLPPDFLEEHRRAHEAGYTLVLGAIVEDEESASKAKPVFHRMHAAQLAHDLGRVTEKWEATRGAKVCTGNVSFRRSDYLRVGGFDRSLERSEDRELGIRLEKAGARVAFARDARTINRSDLSDRDVWMRRNYLYGIYDLRIARRHPDVENADPWYYLGQVNPVSRLLILATVAAPALGKVLSRAALSAAEALDRAGVERPAVAGATLSYGLEYFRGVRQEAGSLHNAVRDLRAYYRKRRDLERQRPVSEARK